jgi:hypothetical protein
MVQARSMLGFEAIGDEIVDAQLERLGGRVPEDFRRSRVPEDYPPGIRLCDDDRVPYALEQPADAHVTRFHDRREFSLVLSSADAGPHALHGGAKIVGGDREAAQLVRRDPLLKVSKVDRAPHAHQSRLPAQRLQVCPE